MERASTMACSAMVCVTTELQTAEADCGGGHDLQSGTSFSLTDSCGDMMVRLLALLLGSFSNAIMSAAIKLCLLINNTT